jgi:hypothetical protein
MTGPKDSNNQTSWGGLAKGGRHWGEWVLKKVKAEIGDLYSLIPDPAFRMWIRRRRGGAVQCAGMPIQRGTSAFFFQPLRWRTS